MFSGTELMVIAGIGLFLFGGNKMIQWARDLRTVKEEFQKNTNENEK